MCEHHSEYRRNFGSGVAEAMQNCTFFGNRRIEKAYSGMTALLEIISVHFDSNWPAASEGAGLDDLLRSLLT